MEDPKRLDATHCSQIERLERFGTAMSSSFTNTKRTETDDDQAKASSPSVMPVRRMRDVSLGSLALLDQMVVSGTNFATVILIANLCSTSQLGIFSLAWTIVGFFRTAQDRMLSAPYLVFVHRKSTDSKSFLGSSLVHQACLAIVGSVTAAAAAIYFTAKGKPVGLAPVMATLIFSMPPLMLRDHIRAICAAHFRYGTSLAINSMIGVVQIGAIGVLWYSGNVNIPWVSICLGIACLVPLAIWLTWCPQPFRVRRERIAADWRLSWSYSRWLVAARIAGMAGFLLVPWIVVYVMDTAAAGAFAACSNLVGLSLMFITGMNNFFQPRTVRAYHDHGVNAMTRSVVETVAIFAVALAMVSLTFYIAGDLLLGRIYGASFGHLGSVAFYLSLSMLTISVSVASGNGLAALGKPKGNFWGELSYCCVSIGTAFWLVPRYGLHGAASSLIAAGITASAVTGLTLAALVHREMDAIRVSEEQTTAAGVSGPIQAEV